jgi:branched-chain amino acid transport system permease protein
VKPLRLTLLLTTLILVAMAPAMLSSFHLGLFTKILIMALFAMSLDLLVGYAGMISLGHAAYFGVAAYTIGLLSLRFSPHFWINICAALATTILVSLIFGAVTMRSRGTYYLMLTLALSQTLWAIAFRWRAVTGGDDGLPGIARPKIIGDWAPTDETSYYYVTLVVTGVCMWALGRIVRSPFGQALVGIRESELRMRVLGYPAWAYQYIATVIAAFFAAVAGILFVYYRGFAGTDYLSFGFSGQVLLMVILGGQATLVGAALGAAIIVILENLIGDFTDRWLTWIGLTYIVVTLFAPRGLFGVIQSASERLRLFQRGWELRRRP